jgi:hypothetical protein
MTVHAYKNLVTGEVFAFGDARPDLEARPNWEKTDAGDLDDAVVDAVAAQSHTARVITEAAKAEPGGPSGLGGVAITNPVPDTLAPGPGRGFGGVLSRNVVSGTPPEVLRAQAAADTEALATHGVLADNVDGSKTRVHVDALNADIVNAPPVGDPGKSGVKKTAAAAHKAAEKHQQRTQAADKAAVDRTGKPAG